MPPEYLQVPTSGYKALVTFKYLYGMKALVMQSTCNVNIQFPIDDCKVSSVCLLCLEKSIRLLWCLALCVLSVYQYLLYLFHKHCIWHM